MNIQKILWRKNTKNGRTYKNDPTIMCVERLVHTTQHTASSPYYLTALCGEVQGMEHRE
jgi:hypothetical protein